MINAEHVNSFDIDMDFDDRNDLLSTLRYVGASQTKKNSDKREIHNSGVYFQDIPRDPFTNLALLNYDEAAEHGFFKIDMLNVGVYEGVRDEEHLISLMVEPDWELLEDEEVVKTLFQIGHYYDLLTKLKPRSVEELAMFLAVIRPAKQYLLNKTWDEIRKDVWKKPLDGEYYFKKSHSTSYSMAIVVQLNLIRFSY